MQGTCHKGRRILKIVVSCKFNIRINVGIGSFVIIVTNISSAHEIGIISILPHNHRIAVCHCSLVQSCFFGPFVEFNPHTGLLIGIDTHRSVGTECGQSKQKCGSCHNNQCTKNHPYSVVFDVQFLHCSSPLLKIPQFCPKSCNSSADPVGGAVLRPTDSFAVFGFNNSL